MLVEGFFTAYLGEPFTTGSSIAWFSVAYPVLAAVAAYIVARKHRAAEATQARPSSSCTPRWSWPKRSSSYASSVG